MCGFFWWWQIHACGFRHCDAVKMMLDAISKEFEDQGDKWDSNDAWRKLRV
jgi:hypothetical protein